MHVENLFERQRQIEFDSVRDGCVLWAKNTEFQQATDTSPYRNLIGMAWRSMAEAILVTQESLKTPTKTKLPAWGLHILSLGHEAMALITLHTLFNMIARSEFETRQSIRPWFPSEYEPSPRWVPAVSNRADRRPTK